MCFGNYLKFQKFLWERQSVSGEAMRYLARFAILNPEAVSTNVAES